MYEVGCGAAVPHMGTRVPKHLSTRSDACHCIRTRSHTHTRAPDQRSSPFLDSTNDQPAIMPLQPSSPAAQQPSSTNSAVTYSLICTGAETQTRSVLWLPSPTSTCILPAQTRFPHMAQEDTRAPGHRHTLRHTPIRTLRHRLRHSLQLLSCLAPHASDFPTQPAVLGSVRV